MPNNVTNLLTVGGHTPEAVAAFWKAIDGGTDENGNRLLLDFNKIKPMPETLDIESGSATDRALDYYVLKVAEQSGTAAVRAALGDYAGRVFKRLPETLSRLHAGKDADDLPDLLKLGEQCFNNIRDYGAPTWYEWHIENWGTKWNAYDQERHDHDTICFHTAWSGVPDLLRELSEQHPGVILSYRFADEDWGCNVGEFEFERGKYNYGNTPKDGSEGARRIAEELLGNPYSEEEDESDEDDWEDEI